MTREEAAEFTRKLVARAETIVFPKTPKTINNIPVFYFEAVLSALRGPVPDPETGPVPCGCGWKAGYHYAVMMRDDDCYVECGVCGTHSRVELGEWQARDTWNRAMGYK